MASIKLVLLFIFKCTLILGWAPTSFAKTEKISLDILMGQTLPKLEAFSLKGLDLPESSKGYVVTFVSAVCPCSDSHVAELKRLASVHSDFQFLFVHSNMPEPHEVAAPYFESKNIPFPILSDPKAKIADEFKAYKTPHTFVLNPKGEVLYKGGVTDSAQFPKAKKHFLSDALAAISKGQVPKVKHGRTLGCQIIRL